MKDNLKVHFSSLSDEWETPGDLFKELDDEFHFTLDPCCTIENKKCKNFFTKKENGLSRDWSGYTVFMNPPYGRSIGKWIEKAYSESLKGTIVVCLIPSRTDTLWWHDFCMKGEIRFIRGRLKFVNRLLPSWKESGDFKVSPAPFPSAIVIFNCKLEGNVKSFEKGKIKTTGKQRSLFNC